MENSGLDELLENYINSQKEKKKKEDERFDNKESECFERYLRNLYEGFKNIEIQLDSEGKK